MQKELVVQFPKRKISLALFNQQSCTQNHSEAITVTPFSWVPGFLHCCSLPGSSKKVISLPVWGDLTGGWSQGLTGSCGHSWRACLFLQWARSGPGCPESQNTGLKENPEYCQVVHLLVCLRFPSLQPGQATSPPAQGASMVGISLGPPEMLQKPVCDLWDPEFARSKLSYRGRRSRRLCKMLTFPLQYNQPR